MLYSLVHSNLLSLANKKIWKFDQTNNSNWHSSKKCRFQGYPPYIGRQGSEVLWYIYLPSLSIKGGLLKLICACGMSPILHIVQCGCKVIIPLMNVFGSLWSAPKMPLSTLEENSLFFFIARFCVKTLCVMSLHVNRWHPKDFKIPSPLDYENYTNFQQNNIFLLEIYAFHFSTNKTLNPH